MHLWRRPEELDFAPAGRPPDGEAPLAPTDVALAEAGYKVNKK